MSDQPTSLDTISLYVVTSSLNKNDYGFFDTELPDTVYTNRESALQAASALNQQPKQMGVKVEYSVISLTKRLQIICENSRLEGGQEMRDSIDSENGLNF